MKSKAMRGSLRSGHLAHVVEVDRGIYFHRFSFESCLSFENIDGLLRCP